MSPQPPALGFVLIILVTGWVWLAMTGIGMADASRMTHLGEDAGIAPGAHGSPAPVAPSTPSAPVSQGNSAFGTPVPPNHLTPAPTLPMNPNRPLTPQQPVAPSPASPPQGFGFSGGGGRFGR